MGKHGAAPKTFYEHYCAEGLVPQEHLDRLARDDTHRMACALAVSGRLDGTQLLGRVTDSAVASAAAAAGETAPRLHRHNTTSHLIPEYCLPLGRAKHYYTGLVAPGLLWRVQSLLLAHETGEHCQRLYREWQLSHCAPLDAPAAMPMPSLAALLEAITPRMCLELIDSER